MTLGQRENTETLRLSNWEKRKRLEGNYELKEKIRIKERTLEEQKMLDHSLRCC